MNKVVHVQRINEAEAAAGTGKSWHDDYNHSAYIFIGGLDYRLTEGDVISVFSQYGEPVDINLARDKDTGKVKGFCFLAYEDQRSTRLAIDNLNGIKLAGRTLSVDHCADYKPPESDSDGEGPVVGAIAPQAVPIGHGDDEEEVYLDVAALKKRKKAKKEKKEKKTKKEKKAKKEKQAKKKAKDRGRDGLDGEEHVGTPDGSPAPPEDEAPASSTADRPRAAKLEKDVDGARSRSRSRSSRERSPLPRGDLQRSGTSRHRGEDDGEEAVSRRRHDGPDHDDKRRGSDRDRHRSEYGGGYGDRHRDRDYDRRRDRDRREHRDRDYDRRR